MLHKILKTIFYTLLVLIVFVACVDKKVQIKPEKIFTLENYDNTSIKLGYSDDSKISKYKRIHLFDEKFKNKIILLDFWATWCPPCKITIPHLVKLQKVYKKEISIISILVEDKHPREVMDFIKEFQINYKVTNGGIGAGNNTQPIKVIVAGVNALPELFVYAPDGSYLTHYKGEVPYRTIERDLEKYIDDYLK